MYVQEFKRSLKREYAKLISMLWRRPPRPNPLPNGAGGSISGPSNPQVNGTRNNSLQGPGNVALMTPPVSVGVATANGSPWTAKEKEARRSCTLERWTPTASASAAICCRKS